MADNYEKRSGKATRQRTSKSVRQNMIKVRMSDEEVALLDDKRGTKSRSRFLRQALHGKAGNAPERITVDVPELERLTIAQNRIGVNVNQIARRWNEIRNKTQRYSSVSMQVQMHEDAKVLEAYAQKQDKTNELLEKIYEAIRKQTMEMQLSKLEPPVRELLEGFGDPEHLPDLVDEILSEERYQMGGDYA